MIFSLKRYFSEHNEQIDLLPLIHLVRSFRAEADFSVVVDFLEQNREIAQHFSQYLKNIFRDKVFYHSLTEANILSENTFFSRTEEENHQYRASCRSRA